MKFRKVAFERWRSMNGRYEIWVQAKVRHGSKNEFEYGARVVGVVDWLGEYFTFNEAITACRSHAAKHARA